MADNSYFNQHLLLSFNYDNYNHNVVSLIVMHWLPEGIFTYSTGHSAFELVYSVNKLTVTPQESKNNAHVYV